MLPKEHHVWGGIFNNPTGQENPKSDLDKQVKNGVVQDEEILKWKEFLGHLSDKSEKEETFEPALRIYDFLPTYTRSEKLFCELLITYVLLAVKKMYFGQKDSLKPHISEKIGSLVMPDFLSQLIELAVGGIKAVEILLEIFKGIGQQTHGHLPCTDSGLKALKLLQNIMRRMVVTEKDLYFQARELADENIDQKSGNDKSRLVVLHFCSNYINSYLFLETSAQLLDAIKCGVKGQILSNPELAYVNIDVNEFSRGFQSEVFKKGGEVDCFKSEQKRKNSSFLHATKQDAYKGTDERSSRISMEVQPFISPLFNDEELLNGVKSQSKDISDFNTNSIDKYSCSQAQQLYSPHTLCCKREEKEDRIGINNGTGFQEPLDWKLIKLSKHHGYRTSRSRAKRRVRALSDIDSNHLVHFDHSTARKRLAELQVPAADTRHDQPANRVANDAASEGENEGETDVEDYRAAFEVDSFEIESEYYTSETASCVSAGIVDSDKVSDDEQEVCQKSCSDAQPPTDMETTHTIDSNNHHDGEGDGDSAMIDQRTACPAACTDDTGARGLIYSAGPSELEANSDEETTKVKFVTAVQASSPGTSSVFRDGDDDDRYSSSATQPQRDEDYTPCARCYEHKAATQVEDVRTNDASSTLADDHSVRRRSAISTAGNAEKPATASHRPAITRPLPAPAQLLPLVTHDSESVHPDSESDDDTYLSLTRAQLPPIVVHRAGDVPPWATKVPRLDLSKANNPKMVKVTDRLATYHRGWPEDCEQDPLMLALAGFYYTGSDRELRCFWCGVILTALNHGACPWEEHAQHSPDCRYLQEMTRDQPSAHKGVDST